MGKIVFITVGSTSFDNLIKEVCSTNVQKLLMTKGYTKMLLQIGKGSYVPPEKSVVELEWYTFKPSIIEDVRKSSLVISHAGAGSILESLEEGKPLIVVINEELMENHQLELAQELTKEGFLEFCNCRSLTNTLKSFSESGIKHYHPPDPYKFSNFLEQVMGYK